MTEVYTFTEAVSANFSLPLQIRKPEAPTGKEIGQKEECAEYDCHSLDYYSRGEAHKSTSLLGRKDLGVFRF